MKNFLKKLAGLLIYFTIYTIGVGIIYILWYDINIDDVPSPQISNSISFNEKTRFLKNHDPKHIDVLSMGSSMNLNNLSSKSVTENLDTKSYLNASSWGINMEENFKLLKILYNLYTPNTLIIASNITDFGVSNKEFRYSLLGNYLRLGKIFSIYFHIRTFSIKYYTKNIQYLRNIRTYSNLYDSLNFDKYGAVKFYKKNFYSTEKRWDYNIADEKIDANQYTYLDSISSFCNTKKIKFMYFQCPIRYGLKLELDKDETSILKLHSKSVGEILQKYNNIYVNTFYENWNDSLFVDSHHFSAMGSNIFTDYCFDNVNEKISKHQ